MKSENITGYDGIKQRLGVEKRRQKKKKKEVVSRTFIVIMAESGACGSGA